MTELVHLSHRRLAWRAFRRDRAAVLGLAIVLLAVLVSVAAPLLTTYSPTAGLIGDRLLPIASPGHPLGTDGQGRDILTRLLYGGRLSLPTAVVPVAVLFPITLVLGIVAGYVRGVAGEIVLRILDILFAFPLVLLAMAIAAVLGAGLGNVMIAISVALLPYMTRVAYAATVQEAAKGYVEAARAAGQSHPSIVLRELLPNAVSSLVVYATTMCGTMIITAAGLSFLGVGVTPPQPDWGVMTADGSGVLLEGHLHVASIPGLAILLVALAFSLIGDGLRDALDPRKQTLR